MYPYNRNTQLYHSRAKETQAEKSSLLAQLSDGASAEIIASI